MLIPVRRGCPSHPASNSISFWLNCEIPDSISPRSLFHCSTVTLQVTLLVLEYLMCSDLRPLLLPKPIFLASQAGNPHSFVPSFSVGCEHLGKSALQKMV